MRQTIKVALLCLALCTTALFTQCEKADEPVNTAAATGTGTENLIPFNEVLATL